MSIQIGLATLGYGAGEFRFRPVQPIRDHSQEVPTNLEPPTNGPNHWRRKNIELI
jgi:hypothetical protein